MVMQMNSILITINPFSRAGIGESLMVNVSQNSFNAPDWIPGPYKYDYSEEVFLYSV